MRKLLPLAATAFLGACNPTGPVTESTAEPTKVETTEDAHEAAGNAVPRDEAQPGQTPPPAKGGY